MNPCILRLTPALILAVASLGQQVPFDRLPAAEFDVTAASARVTGEPGRMHALKSACRTLPIAQTRRRIVDIAVQEWAFFGFPIIDQTIEIVRPAGPRRRGRFSGGNPEEGARVASSIAGYWAVTPEGPWIVDQQNKLWTGPGGLGSRWNSPWSAAFISWVMCEAGLGNTDQFRRAVAHHTYIDQAIRARDGGETSAAFAAYDTGETKIAPGDLLCSARRPAFRLLAERRRQMGEGARMHCDVVVKVDEANRRILGIGGNVGGRVSLKILPAAVEGGILGPASQIIFAHLKLRAPATESDALDHAPTMRAQGCSGSRAPNQVRAMSLVSAPRPAAC